MPVVRGVEVDPQTRCAHWRSPRDVVAIQMKCCGEFWACKDCHEALAGHAIEVWPRSERDVQAILCGACGERTSIATYLAAPDRCPACRTDFNPGCRTHHHFYFEI